MPLLNPQTDVSQDGVEGCMAMLPVALGRLVWRFTAATAPEAFSRSGRR